MKTMIPTQTPKGALKKLNFQPSPTLKGREPKAEVLANSRSSRWSGPGKFGPMPKFISINGVPHKMQDGVLVPLAKKA